MECDVCGQDLENSEELQKHKERMHATGAGNKSMDSLEKPELLGDTPEQSTASEIPKPTR